MHTCALIALPAKGDECLFAWSVKAAGAGRFEVTDIVGGRRVNAPWTKACLERVRRAANGDPTNTEFVICPIGDELVARRDINAFADMLSMLRHSVWGARLFVALSTRLQLTPELLDAKAAVESWLDTARNARVADLFYVDYDPSDPSSISPPSLWDAICRTESRRQLLASLFPSSRPWHCVPPEKPGALTTLLGRTPAPALLASDVVLVVDEADPEFQRHYVESRAERFRNQQLIVVTLSTPASEELAFSCRRRGLAPPISMRGDLELFFFLLRLNAARAKIPSPTLRISPVQSAARNPVFLPSASSPTVLFTSAFDKSDKVNCLAAARDLGVIFGDVPIELPYHVEPLITLKRLVAVLDEHPDLNIWIHSGHGEPYRGLRESGPDGNSTVRHWLHCFGWQKIRLELAVFLTCYSAQVARQFARAGAGVAIGFEGEVDTDTARLVVAGLLAGVTTRGLRRDVIIDSLNNGIEKFKSLGWSRCKPKAYYRPRR